MSCFGIVIADEKIFNPFDRDIIQINAAFTYKALGLSLVFFSTLCNIILDVKINCIYNEQQFCMSHQLNTYGKQM